MAGYKTTPIYEFKDRLSTGIYEVPLGALVYVRDNNGTSALVEKLTNVNLGSGSLIGFFLDDAASWTEAYHDDKSQLEQVTENGNVGWRLLGKDPLDYGDIGKDAVDLSSGSSGTGGATGPYSHTVGYTTTASGTSSHAEGYNTVASGNGAHSEGYNTIASGDNSHAEGDNTLASGVSCHSEGSNTGASGKYSHAEGYNTVASGDFSHSEGQATAHGNTSHAEGSSDAYGYISHSEGFNTISSGYSSHAEGDSTITTNGFTASVVSVIASGSDTIVTVGATESTQFVIDKEVSYFNTFGDFSTRKILNIDTVLDEITVQGADALDIDIAKGMNTNTGKACHAEGYKTQAMSDSSHAEGSQTVASGVNSHSEGLLTQAIGDNSHAGGFGTIAGSANSTAIGTFNTAANVDAVLEVGIGIDDLNRANAFEVHTTGLVQAPALTAALVDANNKALVIREYLFSAEFGNALPTVAGVTGTLYNNAGVLTVSP